MAEELAQAEAAPTPEQIEVEKKKLVDMVEERSREASRMQREQVRMWRENISFFEGMQWLRSRDGMMLNVQGVGRNRLRLVDNRILDHARRLHARLDQVRYMPQVSSDSIDDGDKMAARLADGALKWFVRSKKLARERRKVNWWIVICGQAYVEAYYDPSGGPQVMVPEMDGENQVMEDVVGDDDQPVVDEATGLPQRKPKMTLAPSGDVDFVVRSPFQVQRDYRFQDWKKLRWIIVEEPATREEVKDRFADIDPERLPESPLQMTPWMADLAVGTSDEVGLQRARAPVRGIVIVKRYYERPSGDHPRGRFIVTCGDYLLHSGDMPTKNGDFPIVMFNYLGRPWNLEGMSAIDQVKSIQRLFNRILSRYADHLVRLPAGWLLVPATAGIPKRAFTNETGSVIRYVPGGGEPKFVFPPFGGLQWYDRMLERLEHSMEERMALPPAARGQLPRGARAARTVELLQEAADAIQAPVLNDIADGWTEFYELVLDLMHTHFTVPRLITFLGADKRAEAVEFKGEQIPRDWKDRLRIEVEAGQSLPSTKMMRVEFILTLASKHGLFGVPGDPEYVRRLTEALELGAGFGAEMADLDISIAEDENSKIVAGAQVVPRPIDDHVTHLRVHLQFAKRMVILGREEDAMKVFAHIQLHMKAMEPLMKARNAKNLNMGAGANQPPNQENAPEGGPSEPGGNQPRERSIEPVVENKMGEQQGA